MHLIFFFFFKDFGSPETLAQRELSDIEGDDRTIVNLLTDQIEFANVILLNKCDLVSKTDLGILKSIIEKLNPSTKIIESIHHSKFISMKLSIQNYLILKRLNKAQVGLKN